MPACKSLTLKEIADTLGIDCPVGESDKTITGVGSLMDAGSQDLAFYNNARYLDQLERSAAAAVLVQPEEENLPPGKCYLRVANPSREFTRIAGLLAFVPPPVNWGIDPGAHVAASAKFNREKVAIGPGAVVADEVSIGDGTIIGPGSILGHGAVIGADCFIHAGVSIREYCELGDRVVIHDNSVIGADGFGYEMVDGMHRKIPQTGIVVLGADVEIGAGTTIDRARFGRTRIGEGTKIDNLVQIGHNCAIGRHCIIVSQVGIAGSTVIDDYVVIAAKAGVGGHLYIGKQVVVMGSAGVTKDITEPGYYMGFPAGPAPVVRREIAASRRVPGLLATVRELKAEVEALKARLDNECE